jgi:cytochrome c peroxidase
MRNAPKGQLAALAVLASCGVAVGCGDRAIGQRELEQPASLIADNSSSNLRRLIDLQVGGIEKLMVPVIDSDLPQPLLPDGSIDPRYEITEAKRYLGKQLYFDPVRTSNIRTQFGGIPSTAQTGSCGSCHLGEAAGKAGTVLNGGVGKEGRGYTDAYGTFIPRRRTMAGLVDAIPTLSQTFDASGNLVLNGEADAVDSVQRLAPTMIGFAFNNRLLSFGLAGEPGSPRNPDGLSAGENLTQLTITVHRMFETQSAALQQIPAFVELFREAFPDEAVASDAQNDLNRLINDQTVFRALAGFLRTVVTRNTPWDRFLSGDDHALTARQRRGARLFFTPAGQEGGAGCYGCHSGPMLNKQLGDEAGLLVDENFHNLGLDDHPLVDLDKVAFNDPAHRDTGRMEVTGRAEDKFKFRVLSLRQVKDGRQYTHNGSFTSVRQVVEYFNDGAPQNAEAAAAGTLSTRFTNPRGPDFPAGLGLSDDEVDALADFLENGLYDPAFVRHDPSSMTKTFELNEQDLTYSIFRPDLASLGAIDGRVLSGRPHSNNDALSRRDLGLDFLDVTGQVAVARVRTNGGHGRQVDVYEITNTSNSIVDTHLLVIVNGLPSNVRLVNESGATSGGDPYRRVFLDDGVLLPGRSIRVKLVFARHRNTSPVSYSLTLLSGQGEP